MLKLFFVIALSNAVFTALGQKFYVGAGAGYSFGMNKQSGYNTTDDGESYTRMSNPYSYGKGWNVRFSGGYNFHKNMGVYLGMQYHKTYTYSFFYDYTRPSFNDHFIHTVSSHGRMFRVVPALKLFTGEKKWQVYMRMGPVIGLGTKIVLEENYINDGSYFPYTYYQKKELSGRVSVGANAAVGYTWYLDERWTIYIEAEAFMQNWAMKKSEMKVYQNNGVDYLNALSVSMRETEYVDGWSDESSSQDSDKPYKTIKEFLPFSSVGINAGVNFVFVKKKKPYRVLTWDF